MRYKEVSISRTEEDKVTLTRVYQSGYKETQPVESWEEGHRLLEYYFTGHLRDKEVGGNHDNIHARR